MNSVIMGVFREGIIESGRECRDSFQDSGRRKGPRIYDGCQETFISQPLCCGVLCSPASALQALSGMTTEGA